MWPGGRMIRGTVAMGRRGEGRSRPASAQSYRPRGYASQPARTAEVADWGDRQQTAEAGPRHPSKERPSEEILIPSLGQPAGVIDHIPGTSVTAKGGQINWTLYNTLQWPSQAAFSKLACPGWSPYGFKLCSLRNSDRITACAGSQTTTPSLSITSQLARLPCVFSRFFRENGGEFFKRDFIYYFAFFFCTKPFFKIFPKI